MARKEQSILRTTIKIPMLLERRFKHKTSLLQHPPTTVIFQVAACDDFSEASLLKSIQGHAVNGLTRKPLPPR